jgi:hypothetical protein
MLMKGLNQREGSVCSFVCLFVCCVTLLMYNIPALEHLLEFVAALRNLGAEQALCELVTATWKLGCKKALCENIALQLMKRHAQRLHDVATEKGGTVAIQASEV